MHALLQPHACAAQCWPMRCAFESSAHMMCSFSSLPLSRLGCLSEVRGGLLSPVGMNPTSTALQPRFSFRSLLALPAHDVCRAPHGS